VIYRVEVLPIAAKALRGLDRPVRERIQAAIDRLAENPRPSGCKKLVNLSAWRIRIGDYRVLYEIRDEVLVVSVVDVGHRSDIYR
jgi:mRNA interferase RelE/StbE